MRHLKKISLFIVTNLYMLSVNGTDLSTNQKALNAALMRAAHCGHLEKIKTLLLFGANLHTTDEHGNTALI